MGKSTFFGPGSVEVGDPAKPGESRARRLYTTKDALVTQPWEGLDTVYDLLTYAAKTHGTKPAMGWRDTVDIVEEEKEVKKMVGGKEVTETKKWKYFHLSDYKYLSYVEVKNAVAEVSRALLDLGIQKEDIFNVYASTRCVASPPR